MPDYRRRLFSSKYVGPARAGNFEALKNWSAAVQSLVLAVAVAVGGGWALYRYVNIESFDAKVRGEQLEKSAFSVGNLEIDTKIEKAVPDGEQRYVYGRLIIKNIGTKSVQISLNEYPIFISKIDADLIGHVTLSNATRFQVASDPELQISAAGIRPQREINIPILVKIDSPGFYILSFSVPASVEDWIDKDEKGKSHYWLYSQIIHVE